MQPFPSFSRINESPSLTGTEWIIDANGCDPQRLTELATIKRITDDVVRDLELNVVGHPLSHQFPSPDGLMPGGVTLLYLLSESHLAVHTYPEFGTLTLNLYCCCHREPWDWQTHLRDRLGASRVEVKQIPRGNLVDRSDQGHTDDEVQR
ncbi:S-adenosylmethionine decarboxylase proenzyme precursor [Rubripirellula amarantea]|uniref:S-adenosylmethionine decarboxylase proenzyme n=1 Tax=Rubripirellula amarantea TaxID=2527999 RepID=A0A5C5WTI3_9BACT|nr:S-adenosylmethionine decarboxylase [Rubripirellula amarantea]TWT53489.1 S-adenosylmethionine decarboxylase proenzyme precursor [Rubripirellula amarantea]